MQIRGEQLRVSYGDHIVIDSMDIEISKHNITTIIGPNGSGKSTVLKALTRLLPYQAGNVTIDGKLLEQYGSRELSQLIGVLPQIHTAPPDFRVKELVAYGRMPHQKWYQKNSCEDDRVIQWAMEMTGISHLQEKSIHEISGGELQRTWIATVLAQEPQILFLDEPTTYLDVSHQLETLRLVKKLNRCSGIGVVMVLHDLSHAMEISDRVIVIRNGHIYDEGAPEDVITCKMLREVYHVDCSVIPMAGCRRPVILYREIEEDGSVSQKEELWKKTV